VLVADRITLFSARRDGALKNRSRIFHDEQNADRAANADAK